MTGPLDADAGAGIPVAVAPVQAPDLVQPIYRTMAELSQRPIPLSRIELTQFGRTHPGTQARFSLLINEHGGIDAIKVLDGSNPALAEALTLFLGKIHFVPGKIGERAVNSELRIEVDLPGPANASVPQGRFQEQH